jgi:hypothetical protein
MKKLIFIGILLSFSDALLAQSYADNALLLSRTRPGGSARIQAIGGAQISLGGDLSSALSNPGGLGMFNRSEFSFSPALNFLNANATYLGETMNDSKTVLTIPSLGFVFHHDSERETGFLGGSFAITMTRTNDLNNVFRYRGRNNQSSIIDYFKDDAYYYDPAQMLFGGDDFYNITALAYNNYLIEDSQDNNGDLYYGSELDPFPNEVREETQEETIKRNGNQLQWSIAYGANFSDKFYFGGGLGITSIKYKLTQVFRESGFTFDQDPGYNPLNNFEVEETTNIRGSGINLTLGFIARPVDFIQFGASLVTPTLYSITDNYSASVSTRWNNYQYPGVPSPLTNISEEFDQPLVFKYFLTTPLKLSTGLTFISKFGFISGDVEFVNYAKAQYEASELGDDFDVDNDEIKANYSTAVNYRVGAEYRHDIYRFRAGYNVLADPYIQFDNVNRSVHTISGGFGIRMKEFFIDLAVLNARSKATRSPYSTPDKGTPRAALDFRQTTGLVTVGFTF